MCLGGGGGGASSTSKNEPWSVAQPYLTQLYANAAGALGKANTYANGTSQGGAPPAPGMVAGDGFGTQNGGLVTGQGPFGPGNLPQGADPNFADQNNAYNITRGVAQGAGGASSGADAYAQMVKNIANGQYLDPNTNPTFQKEVQAAINPLNDNFNRVVMPQLSDAAQQSGAYGGSRQGVAQAIAAQDLNRQVADTTATLAAHNYDTERANQLNAPNLGKAATQWQLAPADIYSALSQQQQQNIWGPLQQYANILQGVPGYSTTTNTGSSGSAGLISGALGGAGAGAQLGGLFGGSGSAIGGGLGGILGLLGGG